MFALKLAITGTASFAGAAVLGVMAMAGKEVKQSGAAVRALEAAVDSLRAAAATAMPASGFPAGRWNVVTDLNPDVELPALDPTAYVDPYASVVGRVRLGRAVYVAPFASIRGDLGLPIFIGDGANVQDGAVVHGIEPSADGKAVRTYRVGAREYAVYIGKHVSIAHQALVHGPARIDDNVFVGMQALIFNASVGAGSVIEPGARVIGVAVPAGRYVAAGRTVTVQAVADGLPRITDSYPFRSVNDAVVRANTALAEAYLDAARSR